MSRAPRGHTWLRPPLTSLHCTQVVGLTAMYEQWPLWLLVAIRKVPHSHVAYSGVPSPSASPPYAPRPLSRCHTSALAAMWLMVLQLLASRSHMRTCTCPCTSRPVQYRRHACPVATLPSRTLLPPCLRRSLTCKALSPPCVHMLPTPRTSASRPQAT